MALSGTVRAPSTIVLRRFLLALPLISCLGPLQAATLERLSLDDMIAKSHAIVRGKVTSSWPAFSGRTIYTHYQVQVSQRWKGPEQATVEFVVPGGKVGSVRQVCPGAPQVAAGKDYIFFLWTSRAGLTYIMGFSQGLFEAPADGSLSGLAVRAASADLMFERGQPVRDERMAVPFKELDTRIARKLAAKGNVE